MAMAIPALMLAGAAVSAMGAISQANAQKAASNYNAQINERNALVALDQSQTDAARFRRQASLEQGKAVAAYGASGVSGNEGSPLDVLQMSAQNAKLDEETIRYKGQLTAQGLREGAALDRLSGRTAEQQGALNAASAFMTGVGRAGSTYATTSRSFGMSRVDAGAYDEVG